MSRLTPEQRGRLAEAFDHEVDANCWRESCEDGLWHVVADLLAEQRQGIAAAIRDDRECDVDEADEALPRTTSRQAAR